MMAHPCAGHLAHPFLENDEFFERMCQVASTGDKIKLMLVSLLSPIILRSCSLSSYSFRTGPGSGGIDAHGILDSRNLPDSEFSALWDAIIVDESVKDRLLAQAILNYTLRTNPKIKRA
jgi:hypothetical protein